MSKIKQTKHRELKLFFREGTSDIKAFREVIITDSYQRRDFKVEPGETWIDIGANCGAFALLAASRGANVKAFEPDPDNASIARINIAENGFGKAVELFELGLTEQEEAGRSSFYRNTAKGNVWRNSMYKAWRGGEKITIRTSSVKEWWLPEHCGKLDAEGVEMPILEKYASKPVKKLVFEWSFDRDNSIPRFLEVSESLRKVYSNVKYGKFDESQERWKGSWFPPCRTVWCY